MGFWSKIFARKQTIATSLDLFRAIYGGRETSSGIVLNIERALEVSTVLAICRVIADGVAQVPFKLYREVGGSRSVASDHPLHRLISRRPNRMQSSFEFRETLVFHLLLTGNAFVFINRVGLTKKVKELTILLPGAMAVKRLADGSLEYRYRAEGGTEQVFPAESIWHLRGPSWNGWFGMDALKLARNAVGLAIALEDAHASMHKNGARPSGLLSVDGSLAPEKYDFLAKWLDKYEIGGERYQKAMILDLGAKFTSFGMSGVDSQHVETRKLQIEEMCRMARILPPMVGHSGQAMTFASAEQIFLAHVVHTLTPWYVRIEQSADGNLLTPQEIDEGYYTKFQPNGLMRGAAKDRGEFYAKGLGSGGSKGWLTQNDVRDMEDMNRLDDPEADKLPQPSATPKQPPKPQDNPDA